MSDTQQIGEYLRVQRMPDLETGKTCKWAVLSRDGSMLGRIDWYSPWRCYVLSAAPKAAFNADCLRDLAEFMDENRDRRSAPADVRQGGER